MIITTHSKSFYFIAYRDLLYFLANVMKMVVYEGNTMMSCCIAGVGSGLSHIRWQTYKIVCQMVLEMQELYKGLKGDWTST